MLRRPGHITSLKNEKDIALLDRQLDMLFTVANYSGSANPGSESGGSIWSTSTRPAMPSYGARGYNTDFSGEEVYTTSGWLVIFGNWTTAGRPAGVAIGSQGYNTTIGTRDYKWGSTDADWAQV